MKTFSDSGEQQFMGVATPTIICGQGIFTTNEKLEQKMSQVESFEVETVDLGIHVCVAGGLRSYWWTNIALPARGRQHP